MAQARKILLVGGVAYFLWWIMVELLLPGSFNPLPSRLVAVSMFLLVAAASLRSTFLQRHMPWALSFSCSAGTFHYFYLFHGNNADLNWLIGSYITVVACCACHQTPRTLLIYSLFVTGLSVGIMFLQPTLMKSVFLSGMITILAFANFGMRTRLIYRASMDAVRIRDEFISVASHELRTPLAALRLQTQMALRILASGEPVEVQSDKIRSLFQQIDRQGTRLVELTDCMLDITRLAAGRLQLEWEDINLSELAQRTVEDLAEAFRQARCPIEVHAEGVVPVRGDKLRLAQVLSNLLSNALKYGRGGTVSVTVQSTPEGASVAVEDHGMGVSKRDLERIFVKFERAVSARNVSGMGLGLFISREIMEAHGGRIEVASELGRGSLFRVILPTLQHRSQR